MSKKRDDSYFAAERRKKKKYLMVIVPVIIAVAALGAVGALFYKPVQAETIDGVECNRNEQFTHHIHSHLDVFVDGKGVQVPPNIGIIASPSCFYWLHSHSQGDGVIHIESPQNKNFTLGQFLDIWSKTEDTSGFFSSVAGKNATAYVDGTQLIGNYRDAPLDSLKEIVLVYGKSPSDIPRQFDFAAEGLRT